MSRALLKRLVHLICAILVAPAVLLYRLERAALGADRCFPGWSQALSLLPGIPGMYFRRAFLNATLARCGADCWIGFGTVITSASTTIGDRAYVGLSCTLGDVDVGDDALIASHVSLVNGGHQHGIERLDVPIREQPGRWVRIRVGRDSWIGERAVVMADVGDHCVVGAGSVVTKPIPDYAIAVGNPARVVRDRTQDNGPARPTSTDNPIDHVETIDSNGSAHDPRINQGVE